MCTSRFGGGSNRLAPVRAQCFHRALLPLHWRWLWRLANGEWRHSGAFHLRPLPLIAAAGSSATSKAAKQAIPAKPAKPRKSAKPQASA